MMLMMDDVVKGRNVRVFQFEKWDETSIVQKILCAYFSNFFCRKHIY